MTLTRASSWTLAASVPIGFRTFHPQGMVKIGETLFVSSVEVVDREAGRGVGHLFKIDMSGHLLADLRLGDGALYHPGGIDYDGKDIWVPVAEYRPTAASIVYRVDPRAMKASEAFRDADHIGAHRAQHRRRHAARRELGLAPLLPLDLTPGRSPIAAPPDAAQANRRTTSTTRTASMPAAARCCAPESPAASRGRTPRVPARRHRDRRSRRRTAAPPGAGRAVDRKRARR